MSHKYALLIANADYQHPNIRTLVKTHADVEGMRQVLSDPKICAFPDKNITLLKDRPSYDVRFEIEKFFKHKRPDDLLLLYFAGHGMRDSDGHLCLTFSNTDPEYSESTGIEARVISRHMDRSRSKRQVVMLDCCYSGAFAHGARDVVGSSMDTESAFQGAQGGKGRVVIASSDKQQVSLEQADEQEDTGYAVFTRHVIEGLRSANAADDRGNITIRSLYDYIYERVRMATESKQTPKIIDYGSAGDLILVQKPHHPLPEVLAARLASSDYYVRISGVYELKSLIVRNAEYARTARDTLLEIFRNDRDIDVHDAARHCLQNIGELATDKPDSARDDLATHIKSTGSQAKQPPLGIFQDRLKSGELGPKMVVLPAGSFLMGSTEETDGDERFDDEHQHSVTIDKSFAIGQYPVTNAQYRQFKADHDSGIDIDINLNGEDQPVVDVSWHDAVAYTEWLREQTGKAYRLPTEAEWEYAARAGTKTRRYWGDDANQACEYANVHDQTSTRTFSFAWSPHDCEDGYAVTSPVGRFKPNEFKLYDMLGNVWEWTCSEYDGNYAGAEKRCQSEGNARRSLRGGSWDDKPRNVRSANRDRDEPSGRSSFIGFRLAQDI